MHCSIETVPQNGRAPSLQSVLSVHGVEQSITPGVDVLRERQYLVPALARQKPKRERGG